MEFRRLRAGIKRLRSRAAFSLIETMVGFTLVGIVALFTASGLIAALGIYESANDLRNACGEASTLLFEAAENGSADEIYDPESPQVGVVTHTGDFTPERSESAEIDVYAVCAARKDIFGRSRGIVFYYYEAADSD